MVPLSTKNLLLVFGFAVISVFYYWLQWSSALPVLGGDHAAYLLMADRLSPFGVHGDQVTRAALDFIYFPPLYPMILGLSGATSTNIEMAHAVTITFLFAAFVWSFLWANDETRNSLQSFLLVLVFALIPATFFQSFGILSEPLYLWLTMLAVWLLGRSEIPASRLYMAAAVIGLAAITRTARVALIAAFAVFLFLRKEKNGLRLVLLSAAPVCIWNVLKWLLDYPGGYVWILTSIAEKKTLGFLLWEKPVNELHGLWVGWITSFDHTPVLASMIVATLVGVACIAGAVRRARAGKFDGIYVFLYIAMLLVWPSTPDAKRFLYVILPILLVQGLLSISALSRRLLPSWPEAMTYVFLAVLALVIFPPTGLIFNRLAMAAADSNWWYAKSIYWYAGENTGSALDHNRLQIEAKDRYVASWRKVPLAVSESECVYSVDPTWLMLYANRPALLTPKARTREEFFQKATRCRYVYIASYIHPPYLGFYPREYLNGGRIVFTDRIEFGGRKAVLGMLVEMPGRLLPESGSGQDNQGKPGAENP